MLVKELNMQRNMRTLLLLLALASTACARKVVLEPELVAQRNSKEWTIKQEPKAPAPQTKPKKKKQER